MDCVQISKFETTLLFSNEGAARTVAPAADGSSTKHKRHTPTDLTKTLFRYLLVNSVNAEKNITLNVLIHAWSTK